MESLEEKTYECPSKDHISGERTLDHLKHLINGQPSIYYFCKPCGNLYSVDDNGKIIYVNEDMIEMIPFLLDKYDKKFDPADLLGDEVC